MRHGKERVQKDADRKENVLKFLRLSSLLDRSRLGRIWRRKGWKTDKYLAKSSHAGTSGIATAACIYFLALLIHIWSIAVLVQDGDWKPLLSLGHHLSTWAVKVEGNKYIWVKHKHQSVWISLATINSCVGSTNSQSLCMEKIKRSCQTTMALQTICMISTIFLTLYFTQKSICPPKSNYGLHLAKHT